MEFYEYHVLSFTVQKCSIQLGLQVYIVKLQNLIDTVNTVDQDIVNLEPNYCKY